MTAKTPADVVLATAWTNICDCHPETCACPPFKVVLDGKFLIAGTEAACTTVASAINAALSAPQGEVVMRPYVLGRAYKTQGSESVTFVSIVNAGTDYECMADAAGVHRYTRRIGDMGRVTGSPHDYSDPRNVPPIYTAPPPQQAEQGQEDKRCANTGECSTPALCASVGTCKGKFVLPAIMRAAFDVAPPQQREGGKVLAELPAVLREMREWLMHAEREDGTQTIALADVAVRDWERRLGTALLVDAGVIPAKGASRG